MANRPWELVAVDILEVPMSSRGNQYLLVIQDYFSKWPFAILLPDQKAERIVRAPKDLVFTLVGPPQRLHSETLTVTFSLNCVKRLVSPSHTPPPTIQWETGW